MEDDIAPDELGERIRRLPSGALLGRAALLGLPVGRCGEPASAPLRFEPVAGNAPPPGERMGVVDLSSLWAGLLCSHLLGLAGARVIKVESESRPDGARRGPAAFFDLLHSEHDSVALDFGSETGRRSLRRLLSEGTW